MCLVLVYFLIVCMSIFDIFMLDDIFVIKVEHAQTKSGNGAIGYYPRS